MQFKSLKLLLLPLLVAAAATLPACVSMGSTVTQTYTETEYRNEVVSERYTDNETRIISTTATSSELTPLFYWSNPEISFSDIRYTWYYAYEIPPAQAFDNIRLFLKILDQYQYEKATIRMFDMSRGGQIPAPDPEPEQRSDITQETLGRWHWITGKSSPTWLTEANNRISQAKFLAGRTNLWSRADIPVLEADAGKVTQVAVIISGPANQWNARVNLSATWTQNITGSFPVTRERQVTRQVPYTVEKQKTVQQVRQVPFWEVLLRR